MPLTARRQSQYAEASEGAAEEADTGPQREDPSSEWTQQGYSGSQQAGKPLQGTTTAQQDPEGAAWVLCWLWIDRYSHWYWVCNGKQWRYMKRWWSKPSVLFGRRRTPSGSENTKRGVRRPHFIFRWLSMRSKCRWSSTITTTPSWGRRTWSLLRNSRSSLSSMSCGKRWEKSFEMVKKKKLYVVPNHNVKKYWIRKWGGIWDIV